MLSRFRRPEADLSIHVDKTELHPSEELDARVTLVPKSDFSGPSRDDRACLHGDLCAEDQQSVRYLLQQED